MIKQKKESGIHDKKYIKNKFLNKKIFVGKYQFRVWYGKEKKKMEILLKREPNWALSYYYKTIHFGNNLSLFYVKKKIIFALIVKMSLLFMFFLPACYVFVKMLELLNSHVLRLF